MTVVQFPMTQSAMTIEISMPKFQLELERRPPARRMKKMRSALGMLNLRLMTSRSP